MGVFLAIGNHPAEMFNVNSKDVRREGEHLMD
jgi:hypothetical protein